MTSGSRQTSARHRWIGRARWFSIRRVDGGVFALVPFFRGEEGSEESSRGRALAGKQVQEQLTHAVKVFQEKQDLADTLYTNIKILHKEKAARLDK